MENISLKDILGSTSVGIGSRGTVSGDMLAIEVQRPVSSSIAGTAPHGLSHREAEVILVNLSSTERGLLPKAVGSSEGVTGQTFNPQWSPSGNLLAFVLQDKGEEGEHASLSDNRYYLAIARSDGSGVRKLKEIPPTDSYLQPFVWVSEEEIVVQSKSLDGTEFNPLRTPVESTLRNIRDARDNLKHTARVFGDEDGSLGYERPVNDKTVITSVRVDQEYIENWSIEVSAWPYDIDSAVSPSRLRMVLGCIITTETIFSVAGEGYSSSVELMDFRCPHKRKTVDIAPYQVSLANICWSKDSQFLWLKLVINTSNEFTVGRVEFTSGKFSVFPDVTFPLDNSRVYVDDLIACDNSLVFPVTWLHLQSSRTADWIRFDFASKSFTNQTVNHSAVAVNLVQMSDDIFLGCVDNRLLRYKFNSDSSEPTVVTIDESNAEDCIHKSTYRLVLPVGKFGNSRIESTVNGERPCLVSKQNGNEVSYYCTTDGYKFDYVRCPSSATPILVFPTSSAKSGILALDTDSAGSKIIVCDTVVTHTAAAFNSHFRDKKQSSTKFFTAKLGDDQILCEMIFPSNFVSEMCYPTVVSVYPELQYPKHEGLYAHNCGQPPFLNPHVFAANGCAVLKIGLPVDRSKVAANGVFVEFARIIEEGIEAACNLKLIDKNRLFVTGHSWGGFAATGILSKIKFFRGCIAMSGLYNPIGEYGLFDTVPEQFKGISEPIANSILRNSLFTTNHPWENQSLYEQCSPFLSIGEVITPLLLIHGELDQWCRVGGAEQMYNAMKSQQKVVHLVVYGGEGHIISSRANIEHSWEARLKFIADNDLSQ